MALILDLAVIAVLAFFAWRGAVKGLILTLCGLVAVLVAFGGAFFLSDRFSDDVAGLIQPYIQVHVEELLENSMEQSQEEDAQPSSNLSIPSSGSDEEEEDSLAASLDDVLKALGDSKLFSGLVQSVSDAIDEGVLAVVTTASAAVSAFLAAQIARSGLFLLSFVLILVVWWLLSHVLDLAFRLPVLRTLNKSGGLVIGLAKGALVLLVACWALTAFDLIPMETAQQTFLYRHFMNFQVL